MTSDNWEHQYELLSVFFRGFGNAMGFNYFPLLPPALRRKIWDTLLLSEEFTPSRSFVPSASGSIYLYRSLRNTSPLLLVSKESQACALRLFHVEAPVYAGSEKSCGEFLREVRLGNVSLRDRWGRAKFRPAALAEYNTIPRGMLRLSPLIDRMIPQLDTTLSMEDWVIKYRGKHLGSVERSSSMQYSTAEVGQELLQFEDDTKIIEDGTDTI
ncbi:hypothetical protein PG997_012270 [Apiospora hydei]|uniref:2EXR domain-containing protein n=1 Tax=Apiospora hydei TaxID=1337664 RepID=A0ABR1V6B1_9PEZI